MPTAGPTFEKRLFPNIVTTSELGTDRIQVFLIELVFWPIDDCARRQISSETIEKPIEVAERLNTFYSSEYWIK